MRVLVILLLLSAFLKGQSQGDLTIRISVKVFLNPITGEPAPAWSESKMDSLIDQMNLMLSGYGRGMRLENEGYFYLGGVGDSLSILNYDVPFGRVREYVEDTGEAFPDSLQWRDDHINIYMTRRSRGSLLAGACSFPTFIRDEAVTIAINGGFTAPTILHELGHFFDLRHTHEGSVDSTATPGNQDDVSDTLADLRGWNDYDDMADFHYGKPYLQCTADQQQLIRNTFDNVMSYHGDSTTVMTERQLDRFQQSIRDWQSRRDIISGIPYYVDDNDPTPCTLSGPGPCGCSGTPYVPYEALDCAIDAVSSSGGDIIVVQPGVYEVEMKSLAKKVLITGTNG
ncbi:MAG: M43 family zinc metalloprotease, partial [Bacteroidota bacterium]